jgi:hypothetical protein
MLLYIGLAIIGVGIAMYILHTTVYNHYLRKNDPNLSEKLRAARTKTDNFPTMQKGKRKPEIRIIHTRSNAPAWVFLLGMFSSRVFLIGILVIILSLIIGVFRWIF